MLFVGVSDAGSTMHPHRRHSVIIPLLQSLLLGSLLPVETACSRHTSPATVLDITPWDGRLQNLFDDSIDPSSIGLSAASTTPSDSSVARGEAAHSIVRCRVSTVTFQGTDTDRVILLTLRVEGNPIAGPRPDDGILNLTISPEAPSFSLVQSKDLDIIGTRFIAFVRQFEGPDGPVVHWHLAADTPDTESAARRGAENKSSESDDDSTVTRIPN